MKRRQKLSWFLSGMLATVLLIALTVPAFAALTAENITVYSGGTIKVDGVELVPKDVNGNTVKVFGYNGTVYVPIRAVSEYLGKPASYDGSTQTVYIGEAPGQKQYLLDVCPPYQSEHFETFDTVSLAGQKYANAFRLGWHYYTRTGWALYNLNAQYDTLEFDVGHIDGTEMSNSTLNIYLDGKLAFSLDVTPEMLPTHYSVPLYGALQMKIESTGAGYCYGLANVEIH